MFSKETYRLIVENLTDYGIFTMDFSGIITSWNQGAEHLTGYSKEEVVGKSGNIIFTEEDKEYGIFQLECTKSLKEGKATDERWHMRKNGQRFWASGMMMSYKDDAGKAVGLVKIIRDRTVQ